MPKIRKPGYSKPSAKAPVIHPGDEAPFLYVWGDGEASALILFRKTLSDKLSL